MRISTVGSLAIAVTGLVVSVSNASSPNSVPGPTVYSRPCDASGSTSIEPSCTI